MHHARSDIDHDSETGLVAGVVSAGVLVVAFGALALGIESFWIAFPVGYGAILPLAVGYAKRREERTSSPDTEPDPLDTLRQRYVDGEIDEATFERAVESQLEQAND